MVSHIHCDWPPQHFLAVLYLMTHVCACRLLSLAVFEVFSVFNISCLVSGVDQSPYTTQAKQAVTDGADLRMRLPTPPPCHTTHWQSLPHHHT